MCGSTGGRLIRVSVIGLGRLGRIVARQTLDRDGLQLAGAVSRSQIGTGASDDDRGVINPPLAASIDECVELYDPDVFIYCGPPGNDRIYDQFRQVAKQGRACISLSGQVYPKLAFGLERFESLQRLAEETGSRLTGAGWNPGFLLDVLALQIAVGVPSPRLIRATRVADARSYGPAVLNDFGIGLADFNPPSRNPHYPLDECAQVIASGLGKSVDTLSLEQSTIRSVRDRSANGITVKQGQVAGIVTTCVADAEGTTIHLETTGLFCIHPEEDGVSDGYQLHVEGASTVDVSLDGDWVGDSYGVTAGRGLGAIAALLRMPAGVHPVHHLPLA
jgi:hypothetical protein